MSIALFTIILSVVLNLNVFCQSIGKSDKKVLKEHFSLIENGDNPFWLGRTEVSNAEYKLFLESLATQNRKEELLANRVDSLGWMQLAFGEVFAKNYHLLAVYDSYPVVNISHEAALAYCKWYEDELNKVSKSEVLYKVSLPSEKEWTHAASIGDSSRIFPWEGLSLRNSKGQFMANFTFIPQAWIKRSGEDFEVVKIKSSNTSMMRSQIIAPCESYWPNEYELYNLSGNVAEMLAESGATKGGSWKDTGFYMMLNAPDPYKEITEASPYIGFRIKVIAQDR